MQVTAIGKMYRSDVYLDFILLMNFYARLISELSLKLRFVTKSINTQGANTAQ